METLLRYPPRCIIFGSRAVIRMNELKQRAGGHFSMAVSENSLKRGVQTFKVAIEADDAQHVEGQMKEAVQSLTSRAFRHHDFAGACLPFATGSIRSDDMN